MRTFLVNLDRNPERLASVTAVLAKAGVSFERVAAVDGKALSNAERRMKFAAFRSYCALGRKMTPGEIGCAITHNQIYQRMIREAIPVALIFEDDIVLSSDATERLAKLPEMIDPSKAQVVLLSAYLFDGGAEKGILRNRGKAFGTIGYVITLPAAKQVCQANWPVVTEADAWARWRRRYNLEIYTYWPPIVTQNEAFQSEVNTIPRKRYVGLSRVMHALWRVPQRIVDNVLFYLMGK